MRNYNDYEESKQTREELLEKLPDIIGFHKDHLEDRLEGYASFCEFSTYEEFVHELFAMEDACDATKWRREGESIETLHALITKMNLFLTEWRKQRRRMEKGELSRNNYDHWRVIKRFGR